MPYTEVMTPRSRYRTSPKGKMTAREYSRHYYHTVSKFNPKEIAKRRVNNRRNHYLQYGLTPEKADELKDRGCDLCGTKSGKMNIDHCHSSGHFRGVLCNPCNLMIGWLERAQADMDKIKQYLERNPAL